MHVYFICYAVKLRRKILDRRLNEEDIRSAALGRFSMNLFGDLLEGTCVRIDPDIELVRVLARRLVHKAPVSRPNVDDHSFAGIVG